jgi:ribosome-binding protein aMBF1 (putative translation factor)
LVLEKMDKFDRLINLVQELRGNLSQRGFARKLSVSEATVRFWESRLAWPGTDNLKKLAALKGWTLDDLQAYLERGENPPSSDLVQLLAEVRRLSGAEAMQVAQVALETIASKGF